MSFAVAMNKLKAIKPIGDATSKATGLANDKFKKAIEIGKTVGMKKQAEASALLAKFDEIENGH